MTEDGWRPACGACGSTSLRARTTTRAGVEPAVCFYECTACGKPWDGSEAPEASRADDEQPARNELTELLTRIYLGPIANGDD